MSAKDRLIVALDVATLAEEEKALRELGGTVSFFKVGNQLFTAAGPRAVEAIKKTGAKVFLDLKYHDIPNTVERTAQAACDLGVDLFNVHALGGFEMMECAAKAVWNWTQEHGRPGPKVLGVTVLTSLSEASLKDVMGETNRTLEEEVLMLARMASSAGLDGVVASPEEIVPIKEACGKEFIVLTPGVRPQGSEMGDQKRVLTPGEAIRRGADYLVVGRPILSALNPREVAGAILKEMEDAGA
jgi:orotidine-5'-phosphate decarboxylase